MRKAPTRSRNGLIGGVCSGIADVIGCEALVVRIMFVSLAPLTAGAIALIYLLLWAKLPQALPPSDPLEVRPQEVRSETYGRVEYVQQRARMRRDAASRYVVSSARAGRFVSVGHLPPVPPDEWLAWSKRAQATAQPFQDGLQPEMQSTMQSETRPKVCPEMQSEIQSKAQPEMQPKAQLDALADAPLDS